MKNDTGTVLTCANPECGCRLRIEQPCPHGGTYMCACGHPFQQLRSGLADAPA